jgi:hypothetical protein
MMEVVGHAWHCHGEQGKVAIQWRRIFCIMSSSIAIHDMALAIYGCAPYSMVHIGTWSKVVGVDDIRADMHGVAHFS